MKTISPTSSTVYITATPIGSIADISAHAIDALTHADLIVCEDTRSTKHLLHVLGIKNKQLESLHAHNEKEKSASLIQQIVQQRLQNVVLVTDAGTPAISDPGAVFIAEAHAHGLSVRNVPGASSLVCALAASGFSQPRHIFSGFLPRNQTKQNEEFVRWTQTAPCIAVFFESPKRILKTIKNLGLFFPSHTPVSLSREISKKFEENIVFPLETLKAYLEDKPEILGECVVCVEVLPQWKFKKELPLNNTLKEECKTLSEKYNIPSKEVYAFIAKHSKK